MDALEIAREMLNAERTAVQNAEMGNVRAVEKYQSLADLKMSELKAALKKEIEHDCDYFNEVECLACQHGIPK